MAAPYRITLTVAVDLTGRPSRNIWQWLVALVAILVSQPVWRLIGKWLTGMD